MKIEDYRLADCAQYRQPTLDFSEVKSDIDKALIKAWQEGTSVERATDSILGDGGLVDRLAEQVAERMSFQRNHYLEAADMEKQELLREHERQRDEKIDAISAEYAQRIADKEKQIEDLRASLQQKHQGYSAAQMHLEEMRSRVRKRLGEMGGEEAFRTLLDIDSSVSKRRTYQGSSQGYNRLSMDDPNQKDKLNGGYADKKATSRSASYPGSYEPSGQVDYPAHMSNSYEAYRRGLSIVNRQDSIDPLRNPNSLESSLESKESQDQHGVAYRLFRGVWKVLNYRIW